MRILHVLDHSVPLHSGYTFRTLALLREQRALGWETFHLTGPKQGEFSSDVEQAEGLAFYRTPPISGSIANLPLVKDQAVVSAMARRLESVAREIKPNILHAHSPFLNARAALSVGRKLSIPVVYEVRAFWEDAAAAHGTFPAGGFRYRLSKALENGALKQADGVAVICEGLRGDITSRGVDASKVVVIPNAVDADAFQPVTRDTALATRIGLGDEPTIGFIGSFYRHEGLDLLLHALPILRDAGIPLKVLLVGGGPEDAALRSLVQELTLEDMVIFTGRVPHDQVQDYYALVDAFIYPRRDMRLTDLVTPLKPLEAMAQRKAVLASDIGGHRELITAGKTGTLFSADDPQAIADAIRHWIKAPDDSESLLDVAGKFVTDERTWQRSVAAYRPLYDRLS